MIFYRSSTAKAAQSATIALVTMFTVFIAPDASAQWLKPKMKKANSYISKQDPISYNGRLAGVINQDNSSVTVSISKQRAYLMTNGEVYMDTPISSGKRSGSTPSGSFSVTQKHKDHRSSIYGDFVHRKSGRVVRSGVSTKVDSAPAGTYYRGAPMKYFCRLTDTGVGMHVGILPGYPASHGCIRLPEEAASVIFANVKVGTKVTIQP